MNRRGFTIIELLMVFAVLSILVRLTLPRVQQLRAKATAARIVSDYHRVKLAAFSYYTGHQAWPAEAGPGVIPPELMRDLAGGFTFTHPEFTLDWENWTLPNGMPQNPGTNILLGLSVTTTDQEVGRNVLRILGPNTVHFTSGNTTTYVVLEVS